MDDRKRDMNSNIWKLLLFHITQRRNYMAILSIFFLSLPDTHAKQIGFYMGAGFLASFLLEIPSGWISDKIGHKKVLVIAKVCMILSTISFIFADSLFLFITGSILISAGNAFASGTNSAFLHNTLIELKKDKRFSKIASKQMANASLASAVLMLFLPTLTSVSLVFPLKVNLILDFVGFGVAMAFISPKQKYEAENEEPISIFENLKRWKGTGFYITSVFVGIIFGSMFAITGYREPFLQSLGFPVVLIGSVIALSRFFWFIGGHLIHKIEEKNKIKKMFSLEIIIFPAFFIMISILKNPYMAGFMFALMMGYFWSRKEIINKYYLDKFCLNKNYKATMLSIKNQIGSIFQTIFTFSIGFLMAVSYSKGFLISGIVLFCLLITSYFFMRKKMD